MKTTTIILLVAALAITGCKGNFSHTVSAADANVLRTELPVNPAHVDPALAQDASTNWITMQIFEGLVQVGADDKIVPLLATSWDVKNGGKTYIFHIRPNVKFSNGDPLTAQAFVFSINRACSQGLHSPTAGTYLTDIVGVNDCIAGKATTVSGVKTINDTTLEIDLIQPAPYILGDFAYPVCDALDPKVAPPNAEILDPKNMIGTGPFIATSYTEDQEFTLKTNPTYWNGPSKLSGLKFIIAKDPQTQLNLFRDNKVDVLEPDSNLAQQASADPALKPDLKKYPYASVWYLGFNAGVYKPFADPRVRQAFAMAIDTGEIANTVLQGFTAKATGILPPGVAGYRKDGAKLLPFNPSKAQQLLAQAGYPGGKGLPPLSIYYFQGRQDLVLASQQIQADLQKNLGVSIQVKMLDHTSWLDKENARALPFVIDGWIADYLDPQDFLDLLLTTTGRSNFIGFSDPKVDQLVSQANFMSADDPKRLPMYQEAEDEVLQQAGWLPLYFDYQWVLANPRVKGLQVNSLYIMPYTRATVQ